MAELVDALASGVSVHLDMQVQVLFRVPSQNFMMSLELILTQK